MTGPHLPDQAIGEIAALADPIRRELYRHVTAQAEGAGREAAAAAVGVSRALAAFHLDRLVDAGLLEVSFRRLGERRGPGAGRPAKIYRRVAREIAISLPDRRYDLAAELLASAIDDATDPGQAPSRLAALARSLGQALGDDARRRAGPRPTKAARLGAALEVLAARGYDPALRHDVVVLRNCPFDALAERHRQLICGMNQSIMAGVLEGLRARGIVAVLDPQPGRCCVLLSPTPPDVAEAATGG